MVRPAGGAPFAPAAAPGAPRPFPVRPRLLTLPLSATTAGRLRDLYFTPFSRGTDTFLDRIDSPASKLL